MHENTPVGRDLKTLKQRQKQTPPHAQSAFQGMASFFQRLTSHLCALATEMTAAAMSRMTPSDDLNSWSPLATVVFMTARRHLRSKTENQQSRPELIVTSMTPAQHVAQQSVHEYNSTV